MVQKNELRLAKVHDNKYYSVFIGNQFVGAIQRPSGGEFKLVFHREELPQDVVLTSDQVQEIVEVIDELNEQVNSD